MQIKAAEIKRPASNLHPDAAFKLSGPELKSGFIGVFRKAYVGDARKTLIRLAVGAFIDTSHIPLSQPAAPKTQEERQERKALLKSLEDWHKSRMDAHLEQYVVLKKVNSGDTSHFLLELPVAIVQGYSDLARILKFFSPVTPGEAQLALMEAGLSKDLGVNDDNKPNNVKADFYPAREVLANAKLASDAERLFATCLQGVRVTRTGQAALLSLVFTVPKRHAEYMASMDWLEIRAIDLYPLFAGWVEGEYQSNLYSKTSTSISKIAATLPKHDPSDERIDQYGIGVDYDGDPVFLPRTCNRTSEYESKLTAASTAGEGVFALRTPATPYDPVLPADIPILVDWVNFKFSYTERSGKIRVVPLEGIRKCNPSMAMNLLHEDMNPAYVKGLTGYAQQCNMSTMIPMSNGQMVEVDRYFDAFLKDQENTNMSFSPRFVDITRGTDFPELDQVAQWVVKLYHAMVSNLEALYVRFAVSTITSQLGRIAVIATYGEKLEETRVASNTANKAAVNQGLDPNFVPPALPLLTKSFSEDGRGIQPHQLKIFNTARERPQNMILDVAAGGGKSMLAVTDVLREIAAGEPGPFLILCPKALVTNYVSEIVAFTDGKLNVIPITSYNVFTSGYPRYVELLKAAPRNTVVVADFEYALKYKWSPAGYGPAKILNFPIVNLLRQFKPGYVFIDEVHFLKNAKTPRTALVAQLVADIPKKRLASGTLTPDSPSDLPGILALIDPTILGSRDKFNAKYGEKVSSARVLKWKETGPNAQSRVIPRIKDQVVWAKAERKEWACALPEREDAFVYVELTNNQKVMYDALFDDMIQQIKKDAAKGKGKKAKDAKKLLETIYGNGKKKAGKDDEDDFGDLDKVNTDTEEDEDDGDGDLGPALQPYLANIERFVTDPASHPYARNGFVKEDGTRVPPLTGDDLKSNKALALAQQLTKYLARNEAKALVFVNYTDSAKALFDAMPPELQESGLLYLASESTDHLNKFNTDPKIKWMIGIRDSLETGLNLQVAGYLVRLEGVWTPGEQEQGDSRIARPYFGTNTNNRKTLFFDTIVANHTMDITKAARLRAKIIQNARFSHPDDPVYQAIPDVPIIPMSLDAILNQNDFEVNLQQYRDSFNMLNRIIKKEYADYKVILEAEGGYKFTPVKPAPTPEGCALLSSVPYVQGMELYSASELGLVRVDNYLGMSLTDEDEEEDDEGGGEEGDDSGEDGAPNPDADKNAEAQANRENVKLQRSQIAGKRCHCEYGDGIIVGASGKKYVTRVRVELDDGTTAIGLRATNVFIATRTETNGEDMRMKLAHAAGLPLLGKITAPGGRLQVTKVTKKAQREKEKEDLRLEEERNKATKLLTKLEIGLDLTIMNGYMRVGYVIGKDQRAVKALEALGFKKEPQYVGTRLRSYKHLITQAKLWAAAGFNTASDTDDDTFAVLADEMSKGGLTTHRHYVKTLARGNFQNYMRKEWKATADKKLLQLFAIVTDGGDRDPAAIKEAQKTGSSNYGQAYLCLPYGGGHPATKLAIASKYKSPSTRWMLSDPSLSMYVANIQGVHKVLQNLTDAGIKVNNIAELNKQAKSVKKVNPKTDNTVDLK